ncbi:MAG: N-acetyl-gamma-glutamyl-phosphate reductase [Candidatus Dormibacteraeota bacterium]|nr:N-acetyl-gamma-glutamyl-phosphate reductase [Candidatus Dormibacteraeota bacterium]MBO0705708.1 N-acetyl-gamma-glutamyl-phosphate reductase [Candidatus Dormibacteraeota bacterium]MBO0761232.1 N-acetyl-gamma-glutamyl-phosphate reductase [Candidatus Dormibacteraeota bacterium]
MTLVNLLARHPGVELAQLTSRSFAGQPYTAVFPLIDRDGVFVEEPDPQSVDVIFACLPHNVGAARIASWFEAGARVIDMSADFRLHDPRLYPTWYKQEHPAPDLLHEAVLGLPELHADEIRDARLIACPGCYSTAAILALAPAVRAGLVGPDVVVDAKSGVSGAGRSVGLGTHFSEVDESVHAYALGGHRHLPEVVQELAALAPRPDGPPKITFVPHLIPMVRGILDTCYFDLRGAGEDVERAYRDFYAEQPFTRLVSRTPATKLVSHTNLCAVNVAAQGDKAVVTAAIDNLIKGASGQGVECFNIAFGFDRTEGLQTPLQWP